MSYLALYRKYRPRNFDEVIGQNETTEILKNQIQKGRFGHAYLFSGIRGTGKTSTAKIMAKAVNCLNPVDGNPCNICENCIEINNESFMDVIEIDAASNNGVDNVRELRENSKYLPSTGTHKVYIIDEVQMLSTGAFNALLKTLEEPSEHVVFILATTEPEKIPVTILSRCQRYDFKRIKLSEMILLLEVILKDLNYTYDDEALDLIALKSDGAMRDALSLLEKVISKSDEHLSKKLTSNVLGMVEFVVLSDLFHALTSQDVESALKATIKLMDGGVSVSNIMEQMLMFIRGMMLAKVFQSPSEIIALPYQLQNELIKDFSHIELSKFSEMIEIINNTLSKLKYAANPRLSLELSVVSMSLLFGEKKTPIRVETQPVVQEVVKEKSIEKEIKVETAPTVKVEKEIKVQAAPTVKVEKEIKIETAPVERVEEEIKVETAPVVKVIADETVSASILDKNDAEKTILNQWDVILNKVKRERKIAHAFLIEGNPLRIENQTLLIEFRPEFNFHMENVMIPDNRKIIENVIMEFTGKWFAIETVVASKEEKPKKSDLDKVKDFLGEEFQEILTIK